MMIRNTTIRVGQNGGVGEGEEPSVSYEVDCKVGQGRWKRLVDCSFCGIVRGELEGMCRAGRSEEQAALGRMADEMGVGFGCAKCMGRNGDGCDVGGGL